MAELEAKGYAIIGVSKDKQESQAKFAEYFGLEFPLIADTSTELLPSRFSRSFDLPFLRRPVDGRTIFSLNDQVAATVSRCIYRERTV